MKKEKELVIISGFMGLAIGVCTMMSININKANKIDERINEIDFIIRENVNTCEDIIEWMNDDLQYYADSTIFDMYIYNLEEMIDENRNLLYTPSKQEVYFEDDIY